MSGSNGNGNGHSEGTENQPDNSIPKNASHLAPFQFRPGQSGNPKGRPKRKTIGEAVYEVLMRELPPEVIDKFPALKGKLAIEVVAQVAVQQAIKGDFQFFKEIVERIDGKVPDIFAVSLKESYERRLVLDLLADEGSRNAALLIERKIGSQGTVPPHSGGNGKMGESGTVDPVPPSGPAE